MKRAFTILELLIMSAVGLVLLGIFYEFFIATSTDNRKLGRKLQAIQAAHLLLERLNNDMTQAFYFENIFDIEIFNRYGGIDNGVVFYRTNPTAPLPSDGNPIGIERVEYVFNPQTCRVEINGRPFGGGLYKRLIFEFKEGEPGKELPSYADYLTVTVTGIPDEMAEKSLSDIDERELSTLVTTFTFRNRAMKAAYAPWVQNQSLLSMPE